MLEWVPIAAAAAMAASKRSTQAKQQQRDAEILILAQTIYGEAEGENYASKLAVGMVIRNRVLSHFGGCTTYRCVVLMPNQFSCWSDPVRRAAMAHPSGQPWYDSVRAAVAVYDGKVQWRELNGVHYFVDTSIATNLPSWARNMQQIRLSEVPNFVFLKEV